MSDKVMIPQDEYPEINFVGLLIGPRWEPPDPSGGWKGWGAQGDPHSFTPGVWGSSCWVLGWVTPLPGLSPPLINTVYNWIM